MNNLINTIQNYPEWDELPVSKLLFFGDNNDHMYPFVQARLCYVHNIGVLARIWSFEVSPRAEVLTKSAKIYDDSIVALNICPFTDDEKLISIAVNSKGVVYPILCEDVGKTKLISDEISAFVFHDADLQGEYWGAEITIPNQTLKSIYGKDLSLIPKSKIVGNAFAFWAKDNKSHMASLFDVEKDNLFRLSKQGEFYKIDY